MNWINATIAPLRDLIAFLYTKARTNDIVKRQIIRELRDNLIVFKNAFINQVPADVVIDNLSSQLTNRLEGGSLRLKPSELVLTTIGPPAKPQYLDNDRRVKVGMGGIAAFAALEFGWGFSVCLLDGPAIAATLRSISGLTNTIGTPAA
jgi:hypothetical protein